MHLPKIVRTRAWTCDTCGELILRPRDGWVSWSEQDGVLTRFHLVHHAAASPRAGSCYVPDELGSMHLSATLGARGLARLLGLLEGAPVASEPFAKLVRRLQRRPVTLEPTRPPRGGGQQPRI